MKFTKRVIEQLLKNRISRLVLGARPFELLVADNCGDFLARILNV